jgi:DNA-binding protein H-NS
VGSSPISSDEIAKPAKTGRRPESGPPSQPGYKSGVFYAQPGGDEVWMGGAKGRQPRWLRDALTTGGHTWESLAVADQA